MNFNKAIIAGRLTRDPESRAMPSGQNVVSLAIATNRVWKDQSGNKQEAVEYHNVSAFGKLADICSQYLSKGQLILIEGRIQTRSWEDQSGIKNTKQKLLLRICKWVQETVISQENQQIKIIFLLNRKTFPQKKRFQ